MARRVTCGAPEAGNDGASIAKSRITIGLVAGVFAVEHVRNVAPPLVSLSPPGPSVSLSPALRLLPSLGVRACMRRCEKNL